MKFKVGDRVRIREDLEANTHYEGITFTNGMTKYKNMVFEIEDRIDEGSLWYYYLVGNDYMWAEGMLERVETKTKVELLEDEVGEYLKIKTKIKSKEIEVEFYINTISWSRDREGAYATFKGKQITIEKPKRKMTKEEIEKELGYEIEIVEE